MKHSQDNPVEKSAYGLQAPLFGGFSGTYDYFGGQREPSATDLVKSYEDITYACVSMIAQNIAHTKLRLYVRTDPGQRQPKCATHPVHFKAQSKIRTKYIGTKVEEVSDHPLLKLIGKCNAYHNTHDLLELTQIFLDLTGNAFIYMDFNDVGVPEELYLLPSHLVQPERDENYFVKEWLFNQGSMRKRYTTKEIIHFKYGNPLDPFGMGYAPLRAGWGRRQISSKELSYLDNYLSNMGRPDSILSIKDSVGQIEAERLVKEMTHRWQGSGNGGVFIVDGTMDLKPLNFPAKDYAELEVYQVLKTVLCNCFHIPPDIFELGTSSNRSTKEAAIYSFAHDCLVPRMESICQRLNDYLVPYFSDRLFFEFDPVIEEDKAHQLAVTTLLVNSGAMTYNELREQYNYAPVAWGDTKIVPNGMAGTFDLANDQADDQQPVDDEVAKTPEQAVATATDDLGKTIGVSAAVADLQRSYTSGELSRDICMANATLIFGFTAEEAALLFPELPPKVNEKPPVGNDKAVKAKRRTLRPLAPGSLITAVAKFFKKLGTHVTEKMKSAEDYETKAVATIDFFDQDSWTEMMVEEMRPVITAFYDHASKETIGNLNLSQSLFHTVQPRLKDGVDKSAMVFCQDTLATTKMDLETAVTQLRKEVAEGLEVGEVKNEMMKRVQSVFTDAETERAFRIGATEASRAQHNAMMITAKESGVVKGKTWLLSDDACELCKPLAKKTVGLDEAFTTDGIGPYAKIEAPPRHPYCRCALLLETD